GCVALQRRREILLRLRHAPLVQHRDAVAEKALGIGISSARTIALAEARGWREAHGTGGRARRAGLRLRCRLLRNWRFNELRELHERQWRGRRWHGRNLWLRLGLKRRLHDLRCAFHRPALRFLG